MDFKDYYQTLGVERSASQDEIKRAYRKMARKYHPDVSKEKNAEDKFKEVQEAYEVLKDPEKRAAYDQLGAKWKSGQAFSPPPDWGKGFEHSARQRSGAQSFAGDGSNFSDFFASMFGASSPFSEGVHRGRPGAQNGTQSGAQSAGQDHVARIDIDLEDAYRGGSHAIELKSPELTADGHVVIKPRMLNVKIPAGVIEGQQIRLAGQGSPSASGGRAGDLYLEVSFKLNPLYTVTARDVTMTLPLAPWEAALGATVHVPTLGGAVEMRIPANAKAGQKMRLKGRGLPASNNLAGDQYIILKIVLPSSDTPRAKALYEQMKQELAFDPRADLTASNKE